MSLKETRASDIISRALRLLSVKATGETLEADEALDALQNFNWMLEQFSNERLIVYQIKNELFPVTAGTTSYTIGPSSDAVWQTTRPLISQNASSFIRQTVSGLDTDYIMDYYPNDRFQQIFQKQIKTNYPYAWTNDHAFPISTIRIYPQPTLNLQFGLSQTVQFEKLDSLSDVIAFPPGYEAMLGWNLALCIAPEYGISPDALQVIAQKAEETKRNIKRTNSEPLLLAVDRDLLTHGIYNIYGDR